MASLWTAMSESIQETFYIRFLSDLELLSKIKKVERLTSYTKKIIRAFVLLRFIQCIYVLKCEQVS